MHKISNREVCSNGPVSRKRKNTRIIKVVDVNQGLITALILLLGKVYRYKVRARWGYMELNLHRLYINGTWKSHHCARKLEKVLLK